MRGMIEGFIVNKFRGDPTLFDDGMSRVREITGWRAFGLVPYFEDAGRLPAEDALGIKSSLAGSGTSARVVVLAYPRMSNFDDFDPLRLERNVAVEFLRPGEPIPADADLVILPGSKATIADLAALRSAGWDIDLTAHVRRGGRVLGICGGYQMLGRRIADPDAIEGPPAEVEGLGLLDVETRLTGEKLLVEVSGEGSLSGASFKGYEMHVGRTEGPDCQRPLLKLADGRTDGAVSADGLVAGCHVHGLFADDRQRSYWMELAGAGSALLRYEHEVETVLDALAEHLERHLDCDGLLATAREPRLTNPA